MWWCSSRGVLLQGRLHRLVEACVVVKAGGGARRQAPGVAAGLAQRALRVRLRGVVLLLLGAGVLLVGCGAHVLLLSTVLLHVWVAVVLLLVVSG